MITLTEAQVELIAQRVAERLLAQEAAHARRWVTAFRDESAVGVADSSVDVDAVLGRERLECGVAGGIRLGGADTDFELHDGLGGGSPELGHVLEDGLLDGRQVTAAEIAERVRRDAERFSEALADDVALRAATAHLDSSTRGRVPAVLRISVEVQGAGATDSRACTCGGAA